MNKHHHIRSIINTTDDIPSHMRSEGPVWLVALGMVICCALAFVAGAWAAFTLLTGL